MHPDTLVLIVGAGLCLALHSLLTWARGKAALQTGKQTIQLLESNLAFRSFAFKYLSAFVCATSADWMMGPHVFALYADYGYDIGQIGILFVVGFGSSMIFGTVLGGAADSIGRKLACTLFCGIMAAACILKNFPSFPVLALGRVMGGTATSLLYSSFESWVVCAFNQQKLPPQGLGELFSLATFCNACTAIVAGFAAHILAENFGYVAPFNGALVPLGVCAVLIMLNWTENYGDKQVSGSASLLAALKSVVSDRKTFALGVMSAMFEAVLFVFVFMWTPSLESRAKSVSHGFVFAIFMIFKMAGTWAFSLLEPKTSPKTCAFVVFGLAALCLSVPMVSDSYLVTLLALCLFEFSVGMYFPVISVLKAVMVDEKTRASVSSLFRVPLNLMVLLTLGRIDTMSESAVYTLCIITLGIAGSCCMLLPNRMTSQGSSA